MVDVDHFKKFNDTHGHDIGDQVLKLVGARLAEVGGGGIAYRYGGEEFSVLFPRADLAEALPHLEAICARRSRGTAWRCAARTGRSRPRRAPSSAATRSTRRRNSSRSPSPSASAHPDERLRTPAQVIRAADEALYRAKQGGRNRVSS